MMTENTKADLLADALEQEGIKLANSIDLSYKYPNINITKKQHIDQSILRLLQAVDYFEEWKKLNKQLSQ